MSAVVAFVILRVLVKKVLYTPPSVEAVMSSQKIPSMLRSHLTIGKGVEPEVAVKNALLPAQTFVADGCELTVGNPVVSPNAKSPNVLIPVAWVLVPVASPAPVVVHTGLL